MEALDLVDLPAVVDRYPAELSGGMRKRVGIARAIALRPKYILYDEPTTGLDPVTSAVIDQLMIRMREKLGVTGIVITHDMRSAYTVGSRIAMLYDGRVRQVGTVEEIRSTTDPIVRQFIEGRPNLDNLDSDEGPEHLTTERFIRDVDTEASAERRSGVERRT
jgi:phospholipid/cholesterol/gamma-HCH transport system ATP-binding protein